MRKSLFIIFIAILAAVAGPGVATAGPDRFAGDTVIYGGSASVLEPNVLIIIDDSGSMGDSVPGGSYDSSLTYTVTNNCSGNCSTNAVYKTTSGGATGTLLNASVNNITTSCNSNNPRSLLQTFGIYSGRKLNSNGTCAGSGSAVYVLGNYINWYHSATGFKSKISIARDVVKNLVNTTNGVKFGLMTYHYVSGTGQGAQFLNVSVSGSNYITTVKDMDSMHTGSVTNRQALISSVDTLTDLNDTPLGESLVEALRYYQGSTSAFGNTIGLSGSPATYTSPIDFGCQKNYIVFVTDGMSTADNSANLDFVNTLYGRYDGGNCSYTTCASDRSHSLAGVARYLYETDLRTDITGTQNVATYMIGFGLGADQEAIDLLTLTADSKHGRGGDFEAGSETELSQALTKIIASIFVTDSSFVAPVVPVSPENRTFSGSRLYMGFFRPEAGAVWSGNLKKYGLQDQLASGNLCGNNQDEVLDVTGHCATYDDGAGDVNISQARPDARDGVTIPANVASGTFRPGSQSYWSTVPDAGEVKEGGAGTLLLNRTMAISCATCDITGAVSDTGKRKIYTYLGINTDLTNASNAFSTLNAGLTPGLFGLPGPIIPTGTTTDVKLLINFIHGFDTYGINSAGTTTTDRDWILGDVLHSKPLFVSYATFTFTTTNEADCTKNKSIIFFGSNDGMLHAFKDCDGNEAWAFIPPEVLPTLQYLQGPTHAYFADSSVKAYILDRNNDGTIDPADGDTVILIFGLRRGSGKDSQPTQGLYYAVDVSIPTQPKFIWSIGNNKTLIGTTNTITALFGDMGESWSEPKIAKIKLGTTDKIVALFGGGYDNCNEDSRYGSTQTFSGACGAVASSDGGLDVNGQPITSAGTTIVTTLNSAQYKGRAFYVVEIASKLSSTTAFNYSNKGGQIWSYNQAGSPPLEFSMLSEPAVIDKNYDGYADTVYMGDTGGNIWRFDISSTNKTDWNVKKIFSSNPGFTGFPPPGVADGTNGRKILYNPSVVIDKNFVRIYFGTGDREHPLNRAVVDRFYEVIDKGNITSALSEVKLVDVSTDLIQLGTAAQVADFESKIRQVEDKDNTTYYGWYIRMEGFEHLGADQVFSAGTLTVTPFQGEKVISNPRVFNGIVYFTTFMPNTNESVDPCNQGNTGQSFLWAVNPQNGGSTLNLNTTNDSTANYNALKWNAYASMGKSGNAVYQRTDRAKHQGTGMASPPGEIMGCSGSLCPSQPDLSGHVLQIYWRQK